MVSINKKMVLCAMVGGDNKDYEKMIEVVLMRIRCPHFVLETFDGNTNREMIDNASAIELNKLWIHGKDIGFVGRCEKCGKIYYKEL